MKIQYYREASLKEDYVEVHFREETEKIQAVRSFFSSFKSIMGKKEDGAYKLYPGSIYYLEVVDRIKADLNMRLRLYMDNGEMLILNRTYKKTFLEALQRMQEVTYENHS